MKFKQLFSQAEVNVHVAFSPLIKSGLFSFYLATINRATRKQFNFDTEAPLWVSVYP